jgi:hypothetical protein
MSRGLLAAILTVLGVLLVSWGAALIYRPAGLIVAGLCAAGYGLLVIDVGGKP